MYRLRLFSSALALTFVVGCAGEEGAGTPAAPPPIPPSGVGPSPKIPDSPKPAAPAPAKDEAKEKAPAPAPAPTPAAEDKKAEDKKADDKKAEEKPSLEAPKAEAGAVKLSDEELANIKKLPADEQPLALAQAVCPVSDEHLGAMDTPVKVTAEGRTFYLCCKGCNDDVKKDAKAVLKKLDTLAKK